mgnify:CR=1 FL=1
MRYAGWLGWAAGWATALAAAGYVVVYLYRWEWQRALLSGVLLLVVEVLLVAALVLSRLGALRRRLGTAEARTEELLRRVEESGGPDGDVRGGRGAFRWLDEGGGRSFVFVPVLVATGAVLSGLALVIRWLAGATVRPGADRRLAGRLAALTAPEGGIAGGARLEDRPAVPPARPGRVAAGAVGALAAGALLLAAVDLLADVTQTRPGQTPDAEATVVVFRVEVRSGGSDGDGPGAGDVAQAARELWQSCVRSTSVVRQETSLSGLGGGVFSGALRPALPRHDVLRLRGCLADASAGRALAEVLGEAQVR